MYHYLFVVGVIVPIRHGDDFTNILHKFAEAREDKPPTCERHGNLTTTSRELQKQQNSAKTKRN